MKLHELDISKLIEIVPGATTEDRINNAFDLKYGNWDYANDLRVFSDSDLRSLIESKVQVNSDSKKTPKVLLAGANCGPEVKYLPRTEIEAIDLSETALKKLRERYPYVHTKVMNINNLEFESDYFDIYCCLRSIQSYMVDLDSSLKEAYRVVKKNGICIISIPNGYISAGKIQKGMYDPANNMFDIKLPAKIIKEVAQFFNDRESACSIHELQSEIILVARLNK